MNLSIQELLAGNPARLRNTWRYSTCRVAQPESVAEHSYYVAFYCLMVGTWVRDNERAEVHFGRMLAKALVHDLEESVSGDFPRSFKYSDPHLREMLEGASNVAMSQVLLKLIPPEGGKAPETVAARAKILDYWATAKDSTTEGLILEFCDYLSVLSFLLQEMQSGNQTVGRHVDDVRKYADKFLHSDYEFLRSLERDAAKVVQHLFPIPRT